MNIIARVYNEKVQRENLLRLSENLKKKCLRDNLRSPSLYGG